MRGGGLLAMVGIGVTTFALEFATVVPYMAAIGLLTTAELPPPQWLGALAAYNLVMVAPSLVLLVGRLTLGERLRDRFDGWAERLDAASRPAAAWIVGLVGVILLLDTAPTVVPVLLP